VLRFKQAKIFDPYIKLNLHNRKNSTTTLAKNLYKLLNNALFGKCLYRCSKQKDFTLAYTQEQFLKNTRKFTLKSMKILCNNIALFHHQKKELKVKFPSIIGSSILDISKKLMYTSYYEGFKKALSHIELIYTDTDSM